MIADREAEINAFVSEEYWSVHANFTKDNFGVESELVAINNEKPDLKNEDDANDVIQQCQNEFVVSKIERKERSKASKLPFITSTLQQEASTKLRFAARKTMSVAQSLYEGVQLESEVEGLITYMRTDSYRLSPIFL